MIYVATENTNEKLESLKLTHVPISNTKIISILNNKNKKIDKYEEVHNTQQSEKINIPSLLKEKICNSNLKIQKENYEFEKIDFSSLNLKPYKLSGVNHKMHNKIENNLKNSFTFNKEKVVIKNTEIIKIPDLKNDQVKKNKKIKKQESSDIPYIKFFILFLLKLIFFSIITIICWIPALQLNSYYKNKGCIICGEKKILGYNFEIEKCTRKTFYIYTQSFWLTYLPGFYNIYEFVYLTNKDKFKNLLISFSILLIIHYSIPLILYDESGRLFPMNVISIFLGLIMAFGAVINFKNYLTIIKYFFGFFLFYGAFIIILIIPLSLQFFKNSFKIYFPFAIIIILFFIKIFFKIGLRILFYSKLINIEHLFTFLVGVTVCIDIFKFTFFLKQDLNWVFYLSCIVFLLSDISEDFSLIHLLEEMILRGSDKKKFYTFLRKILFIKHNSRKLSLLNEYIVPESFCIKIFILVFYYLIDQIGVVVHPENRKMDSCKLEWKYRKLISEESLRIALFFIFTLISRYLIVFLIRLIYTYKKYKLYSDFNLRSLISYGCNIFIFMHIVFEFSFNYM